MTKSIQRQNLVYSILFSTGVALFSSGANTACDPLLREMAKGAGDINGDSACLPAVSSTKAPSRKETDLSYNLLQMVGTAPT